MKRSNYERDERFSLMLDGCTVDELKWWREQIDQAIKRKRLTRQSR